MRYLARLGECHPHFSNRYLRTQTQKRMYWYRVVLNISAGASTLMIEYLSRHSHVCYERSAGHSAVSQWMLQHSLQEMLQEARSKKDYLGTKRSLVSQRSIDTTNENIFIGLIIRMIWVLRDVQHFSVGVHNPNPLIVPIEILLKPDVSIAFSVLVPSGAKRLHTHFYHWDVARAPFISRNLVRWYE